MTYREGDVEQVLSRLGLDYSSRGFELNGKCPGHLKATGREDHNPSWSINWETGAHHCFSCGYKGGLLSLICDLLGFEDYEDAKRWLDSNVEIDVAEVAKQMLSLKTETYRYVPKPVPMSEARLAVFTDAPDWALKERDLTRDGVNAHGVRWMEGFDNWILPIRDPEDFKLLGWQEKGQGHKHFRNRPAGMKKAATLFGIEQFRDLSLTEMVLVESPLDVVRLTSMGVLGGVAAMGASVSLEQVKLLKRADLVTLALDNDKAGESGTKEVVKLCRKYGIEFRYFNYDNIAAKDIGDMTADEVRLGIKNSKHMAFGKLALL